MGDGMRLNRRAYEQLVLDDLEWLDKHPATLERQHIRGVLLKSIEHEYGSAEGPLNMDGGGLYGPCPGGKFDRPEPRHDFAGGACCVRCGSPSW